MTDNKPTQSDELKACPCCSSAAKVEIINTDFYQAGYIFCVKCGIRTSGAGSKSEAIADWNTRASTPPAVKPKLQDLLDKITPENLHHEDDTAPQAEGEVIYNLAFENDILRQRLAGIDRGEAGTAQIIALSDKLRIAAQSVERLRRELEDVKIGAENQEWETEQAYNKLWVENDETQKENTQLRLSLAKAEEHGRGELLDLLEIMWNGYENGTPCYEDYDPENNSGTPIGNAFQIDEETENKICKILNEERPVGKPTPPQPAATPDEIGGGG